MHTSETKQWQAKQETCMNERDREEERERKKHQRAHFLDSLNAKTARSFFFIANETPESRQKVPQRMPFLISSNLNASESFSSSFLMRSVSCFLIWIKVELFRSNSRESLEYKWHECRKTFCIYVPNVS